MLRAVARRASASVSSGTSTSFMPALGQAVLGSQWAGFATDGEKGKEYSENVQRIADQICGMTVLEVADLHELLKDRLRIEAAPAMAMPMMAAAAPAAAAPAEEEKAEEKTHFNVVLEGFDAAKKIAVVKEVRTATGLGLKESKELVEGAPKTLKDNLPKADADALVKTLTEAGAKCKLE